MGSRPELLGQGRRLLRLAPLAVIGGVAGAVLLLVTPAGVFDRIVPFLVALAAVALLIQLMLSRMCCWEWPISPARSSSSCTGPCAGQRWCRWRSGSWLVAGSALRWHGGYPKTFSASWSHWPGSGSQCTCGSAPVSGSRWRDGEHAGATWSTMTLREKRQGAWLALAAHTSRQLERSTQPSSSRPIVQLAAAASRPPCGRRFAMASPA